MYRGSSSKLNLSLYRTEEQSKIIDEKYYYLQIRERHYRRLMTILQQKSNGRTFEDIYSKGI